MKHDASPDWRRRMARYAVLLALPLVVLVAPDRVLAAEPTSVTIAGSLQSELGCSGDWQPDCPQTQMTYDANDGVWQFGGSLPGGSFEYKAALNGSWDENYGLHATPNGANIPLALAAPADVKFYYDNATHWVTDNRTSVIATAAGSFQSELGCSGDWDPSCLRSWLEDPDGDGTYTFVTTALPAGDYETKAAINEGWDENYGAGGTPDGANIAFTVTTGATVTFSYNGTTHVLTVDVSGPAKIDTSTAITGDTPDPSTTGQAVTVTYSVAPASGSGTPTGNVTVSDGVDSCTGTVAAGQCTITLSTAGARLLTAVYAGDSAYNGSTSPTAPHTVATPNAAPTATVINGHCATWSIDLALTDADGDPLNLALTSNSNTALLPNSGVALSGSGGHRTLTVSPTPRKKGTATLTFTLSDGTADVPVVVTVIVGTDKNEVVNGTPGTDMIFALSGQNTVSAVGGDDLICGGNSSDVLSGGSGNDIIEGNNGDDALDGGSGNDVLRGGGGNDVLTGATGADIFDGGPGTDTATDYTLGQGDTVVGTLP